MRLVGFASASLVKGSVNLFRRLVKVKAYLGAELIPCPTLLTSLTAGGITKQ